MVLSTVAVPLPEELALLGAGYVARRGGASLLGAYLAGLAGVLVGDTATFLLGRGLLPKFLKTRWGRKLVKPSLRKWAESMVRRNGFRAVLIGRFLVALRGPVYLAIGAAKLSTWRFIALNSGVAAVEVAIMVGVGYMFGASSELAEDLRWIQLAIGVVLTLALVVAPILVKRRIERQSAA